MKFIGLGILIGVGFVIHSLIPKSSGLSLQNAHQSISRNKSISADLKHANTVNNLILKDNYKCNLILNNEEFQISSTRYIISRYLASGSLSHIFRNLRSFLNSDSIFGLGDLKSEQTMRVYDDETDSEMSEFLNSDIHSYSFKKITINMILAATISLVQSILYYLVLYYLGKVLSDSNQLRNFLGMRVPYEQPSDVNWTSYWVEKTGRLLMLIAILGILFSIVTTFTVFSTS